MSYEKACVTAPSLNIPTDCALDEAGDAAARCLKRALQPQTIFAARICTSDKNPRASHPVDPAFLDRHAGPYPSATMTRGAKEPIPPAVLLAASEKDIINFLNESHASSRRFDISRIADLDTIASDKRDAITTKLT